MSYYLTVVVIHISPKERAQTCSPPLDELPTRFADRKIVKKRYLCTLYERMIKIFRHHNTRYNNNKENSIKNFRREETIKG